jgi:hypothetical protein
MLRSLTYTAGEQPFIDMMHDFVESHKDHPASTESFKAIAEKHITKEMDLENNGRLDWFFNEWVYGTDVPRYHFENQTSAAEGGKVKLHMTITQSEVGEHFAMRLPCMRILERAGFGWGKLACSGIQPTASTPFSPACPRRLPSTPPKRSWRDNTAIRRRGLGSAPLTSDGDAKSHPALRPRREIHHGGAGLSDDFCHCRGSRGLLIFPSRERHKR